MSKPLKRILVTNDDGIDAPGLKIAKQIADELSDDVWIVAPAEENSGASHSLTFTRPIRLVKKGPKKYAVTGTPTDCVVVATRQLLRDNMPDLVLSGVNFGQNIAEDVSYSGTVSAAKEGTIVGIPSVALSQMVSPDGKRQIRFQIAARHGAGIIRKLVAAGWPQGTLININFPHIDLKDTPEIAITTQGKRDINILQLDERFDPRGTPYYWYNFDRSKFKYPKGSDIAALYSGKISVTPLKMDHTDTALKRKFSGLF
jgi:5'-nucleotidase